MDDNFDMQIDTSFLNAYEIAKKDYQESIADKTSLSNLMNAINHSVHNDAEFQKHFEYLQEFFNQLSTVEVETQHEINRYSCDQSSRVEMKEQLSDELDQLQILIANLDKKLLNISDETNLKQKDVSKQCEMLPLHRLRYQLYCFLHTFKIDWSKSSTPDNITGCLRSEKQKTVIPLCFNTSSNDLTEELWSLLDKNTNEPAKF